MTDALTSAQHDTLRVLTLNRPARRNALSPALVADLRRALAEAVADPTVGALVLAAQGEHFCAGGDLGASDGEAGGFFGQHDGRGDYARLLLEIVESPLPVVAAVQGPALGGGLGLVAACHLVVMAPGVELSTPELRLGLFPWMIAPVLLRKLPRNLLHEMFLCGRKLSGTEALALGLANGLAEADRVLPEAMALAARAASSSPLVRAQGLRALARIDELPLDAALRFMHGQLSLNLMTEDAAEGISAFLARRPPQWTGR